VAADRVPSDDGSAIADGTAATADSSRGGARTTFRFLDAVRGGLDERESARAGCLGVARRRFFALTVPASLPAAPGRLCGGLAFCDVPGVRPDRRASCRVLASVCYTKQKGASQQAHQPGQGQRRVSRFGWEFIAANRAACRAVSYACCSRCRFGVSGRRAARRTTFCE
jgi:hypothetical protein